MKRSEKELATAQIMHMFRNYPRTEWVPGHLFDNKSRVWVAVFNDLVKRGFIERRKKDTAFQYRWAAAFPEGM